MIKLLEKNVEIKDPQIFDHKNAFVCRAVFQPDEQSSGYTAFARNLPGVISEGDTLEEAIENVKEAFALALECYLDSGDEIPWSSDRQEGGLYLTRDLTVVLD